MGSRAGLVEKVEMIGEREIDVLLLPEMSRAERAGRAKKTNDSHCPALRRRRRGEAAPSGEAASWLHWKGKVTVLRLSAYILPAASRDTARRAWRKPSCYLFVPVTEWLSCTIDAAASGACHRDGILSPP
jgi:hypothetical protein